MQTPISDARPTSAAPGLLFFFPLGLGSGAQRLLFDLRGAFVTPFLHALVSIPTDPLLRQVGLFPCRTETDLGHLQVGLTLPDHLAMVFDVDPFRLGSIESRHGLGLYQLDVGFREVSPRFRDLYLLLRCDDPLLTPLDGVPRPRYGLTRLLHIGVAGLGYGIAPRFLPARLRIDPGADRRAFPASFLHFQVGSRHPELAPRFLDPPSGNRDLVGRFVSLAAGLGDRLAILWIDVAEQARVHFAGRGMACPQREHS